MCTRRSKGKVREACSRLRGRNHTHKPWYRRQRNVNVGKDFRRSAIDSAQLERWDRYHVLLRLSALSCAALFKQPLWFNLTFCISLVGQTCQAGLCVRQATTQRGRARLSSIPPTLLRVSWCGLERDKSLIYM